MKVSCYSKADLMCICSVSAKGSSSVKSVFFWNGIFLNKGDGNNGGRDSTLPVTNYYTTPILHFIVTK